MTLKKIKNHLFTISIATAYLIMFLLKPSMGIASIKNSGYYIKEMIMIMPVIFVLTALLDTWVPKEKIAHYLGKDAKFKGTLLSLVLGSVSAGPIYAAFPMCIMLHKKGASIKNLVIILSSWAVIKLPMLLNEMKFLGFKFMIIRWALTVIAIILFACLTEKIVKDGDLAASKSSCKGLRINSDSCMGCKLCTKLYPECFVIQNKRATLRTDTPPLNLDQILHAVETCPVKAITYTQ